MTDLFKNTDRAYAQKNIEHLRKLNDNGKFPAKANLVLIYSLMLQFKLEFAGFKWPKGKQCNQ